ncbi:MAG: FtsX-like permease family protein, partial [Eubacteriales bacterium]|nr:FtsX-like permease family protein [Eubacteriales bacterium]
DPAENMRLHANVFTQEYIDYLEKINPAICESIGYTRIVGMNLLRKIDDNIFPVSIASDPGTGSRGSNAYAGMSRMGLSSYPDKFSKESEPYLEEYYDLLAGKYPKDENELVLVVDTKNRININVLERLGFKTEGRESIKFDEIIGTEIKLISNDDYYVKTDLGNFVPGADFERMYGSEDSLTLRISAVVRQKKGDDLAMLKNGIAYSDSLTTKIIDRGLESEIVKAQKESSRNVITMEEFDDDAKKNMLSYLGGNATPFMIMIYPTSFENKDAVTAYLDAYNDLKPDGKDKIFYTDLAETIANMTKGIMDGITVVLIAFAATALIVSLIMIGIITYTSVLERTKEIGILKALGARKKDITRVFDAETFIIGIFSGVLGVLIAWLLTFPANRIIYKLTDLPDVAQLKFSHLAFLVAISTVLTVLGGHIPARMASKKDAIEALKSE